MKKKILSALLTVIMIISMLSVMCPAALAADTVDVNVGETYSNTTLTVISDGAGGEIGLITSGETKNGITVSAVLSEDSKTLTVSYNGTPQGAGIVDFEIKYSIGGAEQSYTVVFTAIQQKTEALPPEILTAEPVNLMPTYKQTDAAVDFKVEAQGNGTVSYRWRIDGTEVSSGSSLTVLPEEMTVGAHVIECVVSNTIENTTKHEKITWNVTIEEGDAPKITSEVTKGTIDGTGSVSFVVTAEGDDLKYQWYMVSGSKKEKVVDGTYGAIEYAGATTNKLTVKCTMAPKDAATKFICEVTGANGLSAATGEYELKITEDPNADKVQKIEIITGPKKTTYIVGETLDEDGLKIKVVTGKDEEEITSGFVCSPLYLEEEGKQTITVSYGGKTVTFTVTVEPAPHEHEWSDWQVENGENVKVYRECIAGDDCTAREVISKDSFIVQFPTIADELGLTMGDDKDQETDNDSETGETVTDDEGEEPEKNEDKTDKENDKKKNGSGILWAIIIIALILLAAVIAYYFLVYRKPYKKPTNRR